MTMIIRSLIRFGRRQLHTIVSREIIKPSSPTPSHLRTYNLSVADQFISNAYMPIVAFFPNTGFYGSSHDKTLNLKNSLSQTLTKYYPFAGRHAKVSPAVVDCNDDGAEFLEASIDSTLSDFLQNSNREDLDQFFPLGLIYCNSNDLENDEVTIPLAVQVNHFECGGVAVAVSMSHKIADASSLVHFVHDWANMTRFSFDKQKQESIVDPKFNSFEYMNLNCTGLSHDLESNDCVTRSFMFPNSMINELKLKLVKPMEGESGEPIKNPTRVEVLNWHLYKCAVAAATKNNAGSFKPTGVNHLINIRGKLMEPLHEKSVGNFVLAMEILTKNESEMKPYPFISELKKKKIQYQGFKNIETVFGLYLQAALELKEEQKKFDDRYVCTSMCRFPAYDIDFGWGKPAKTTIAGNIKKNSFILMDAPNMDGIEALVCLGKQDMAIFQSDHDLLDFS